MPRTKYYYGDPSIGNSGIVPMASTPELDSKLLPRTVDSSKLYELYEVNLCLFIDLLRSATQLSLNKQDSKPLSLVTNIYKVLLKQIKVKRIVFTSEEISKVKRILNLPSEGLITLDKILTSNFKNKNSVDGLKIDEVINQHLSVIELLIRKMTSNISFVGESFFQSITEGSIRNLSSLLALVGRNPTLQFYIPNLNRSVTNMLKDIDNGLNPNFISEITGVES